jgi:hypothetical protein
MLAGCGRRIGHATDGVFDQLVIELAGNSADDREIGRAQEQDVHPFDCGHCGRML